MVEFSTEAGASQKDACPRQHLAIPFTPSFLGKVQNFLEKFLRETLAIQIMVTKDFLNLKN